MSGFRRLLSVALVLLAAGCAPFAGRPVAIVEDGQPRATIAMPAQADEQVEQAARLLAAYIKESTGAELPVAAEPGPEAVRIHVGQTAHVHGRRLGIEGLDDDGFVIDASDPRNIVIAGPTPWGTEFGVYEFLERYVGVRWLMPSALGDDVPEHRTLAVPRRAVRGEPAFFSRLFSGLEGEDQAAWARRNRMHGRVSFHHHLIGLIPPETYTKTHPHFFPIHKGVRFLPPSNSTHGWQPCFSADGLVEEAVKNICRFFDEHPEATSYSLGVNDSSGHCECEKCQAQDPTEPNFLGRRDVSDRYFAWCNQVVAGVLKKHPGKWFGCLAYSEVAQPPSRVKVHERIIPYMTYDRMKWIDPELRAEGERMTEAWQAMSPVVGWYDYIYGWSYCVPRVWFHVMGDYYRYGYAHGVRALYAEAYPNWGEGPKLYVSLKLQWNPRQSVDALLRDWYVRCVGEAAADDLAAYYALWEDFWTRRILDSKWFSPRGQYLRFSAPDYLADVTEDDVAKSRELLERVVAKAGTPKQQARAKAILHLFEYYEASAIAYNANRKAAEMAVETEADALRALDLGERALTMAEKRQRLATEDFRQPPILVRRIDFDRYPLLRGDDWGSGYLWLASEWADRSEAVRQRLQRLAASPVETVSNAARTFLLLSDKATQPISTNPSFEDPAGKWPKAWGNWVKWDIGTKTVSPAAARTGKQGVLCKGMKRGGPHQAVEVTPGRYAAIAYVRVPRAPKGKATLTLNLTPLGEKGQNLASGLSTSVRAQAGDWRRLAVAGRVPASIGGEAVKRVRLIVIVDGFEPGEEVHIDDLALYRIE